METGKTFIPMVPSTPPPIDDGFEDDDEDDFGSFASAGFGKDLVGSPPAKSIQPVKENDRHFDFQSVGNSLPVDGPIKSNGNSGEQDDFGNFASFGVQSQTNPDLGKSASQNSTKIETNDGDLFSEFSSSNEPKQVETKPNGDVWKHHNHIESSSNNNCAGDSSIGQSNHIGDSEESSKFDDDEQETDYSFRLKLSRDDTLDLKHPGTYNIGDDDLPSGDINWDVQGAATPSSRSRSPENSTSGSQTPSGEPCEMTGAAVETVEKDEEVTQQPALEQPASSETEHVEMEEDQFGDFTSNSSANVPPLDSKDFASSDTGNVPCEDVDNLGQTDLDTQENSSRTRHDSFGDFSSGPQSCQDIDTTSSQKISSQETTEIPKVDNTVTKKAVDIKTTFQEVDEDDESSIGRPEPPAFPDNDHDDEEDDEFGDFGTVSKSSDDFGDFGDFKSTISNKPDTLSLSSSVTSKTNAADDFGGFESGPSLPHAATGNMSSTDDTIDDDDFGNFGAFQDSKVADTVGEDDFGDFGSFEGEKKQEESSGGFASFQSTKSANWTTSSDKPTQTSSTWSGTGSRVDRIFQTCFPTSNSSSAIPSLADPVELLFTLVNSDFGTKGQVVQQQEKQNRSRKKSGGKTVCVSVWANLSDLEKTQAVKYQWAGSGNGKLLLASLGLDSRNILASKKAAGIPIFAANLGMLTPSKPGEKSEHHEDQDTIQETIQRDSSTSAPTSSITSPDESVPKAEFDWSSSGLTNPLDANSLNLDFFTKEGKKSSSSGGTGASSKQKSRSGLFSRLLFKSNKSDCDTDSDDCEPPPHPSSKFDKTKTKTDLQEQQDNLTKMTSKPVSTLHDKCVERKDLNELPRKDGTKMTETTLQKCVERKDVNKFPGKDGTKMTEATLHKYVERKDLNDLPKKEEAKKENGEPKTELQTTDILKPSEINMVSSTKSTQPVSSMLHPLSIKDLHTPDTSSMDPILAVQQTKTLSPDSSLNNIPSILSDSASRNKKDTDCQEFNPPNVLMKRTASEQLHQSEPSCESVEEVVQASLESDPLKTKASTYNESHIDKGVSLDRDFFKRSRSPSVSIEALSLNQLEDFDPFSPTERAVQSDVFGTTVGENKSNCIPEIDKPAEEFQVFSHRSSDGKKSLPSDDLGTAEAPASREEVVQSDLIGSSSDRNKSNGTSEINEPVEQFQVFSPRSSDGKKSSTSASLGTAVAHRASLQATGNGLKPAIVSGNIETPISNSLIPDRTKPDMQASKLEQGLKKEITWTFDSFNSLESPRKENGKTSGNINISTLDETVLSIQTTKSESNTENAWQFDAFNSSTSSGKGATLIFDNITPNETLQDVEINTWHEEKLDQSSTQLSVDCKSSSVDMTSLDFSKSKTDLQTVDDSKSLTLDISEGWFRRKAPPIDPEILGLEINLPTPAKPPQNTNKPLDDILKNSSTSTMVTQRNKRDDNLSGEAKKILDYIPNLSFMHAKVLMFPVGPSPLTRQNGDDFNGKKESTL